MSEPASRRFTAAAAAAVRAAILSAGGNEVFFVGKLRREGDAAKPGAPVPRVVHEVEVRARGNEDAVPAVLSAAKRGDVVIHNHPSGVLLPSAPDIGVASELGDHAVGFYIVDSSCERCYAVVEPFDEAPGRSLDVADLASLLAPGGPLVAAHPGYEDRPQQREMLEAVARALNEDRLLVAEAGTGTGKSLAYLIPVAAWAQASGERVVISTQTIALQEQLVHKDIPLLARLGFEVEAALVKGRGNYLCLRKLKQAMSEDAPGLFDDGDRSAIAELGAWSGRTADGSLADLPAAPRDEVWEQVRVESDDCSRVRCAEYARCFFFAARRRASRAGVLVVNHHLLMADLALRAETNSYGQSFVLPPFARVVIDEAHHLEDAATGHFGERASAAQVRRLCARLANVRRAGRGLLPLVAARLEQAAAARAPDEQTAARALSARIREDVAAARAQLLEHAEHLFGEIGRAVEEATREADGRLRITDDLREASVWLDDLYPAIAELRREVQGLAALVARVAREAAAFVEDDGTPLASALLDLRAVAGRFAGVATVLDHFTSGDDERCQWIEAQPPTGKRPRQVTFCAAPVDVGAALYAALHDRFGTVVATSATLAVGDSFEHFEERTGLALAPASRRARVRVASPFDFARQALLAVPDDLPPPDHPRAEERLAGFITEAAAATGGRMLALFTSYASLKRVHAACAEPLASRGVTVRRQGDESRGRLLDWLRGGGRNVLLATDSFWEGVDVPGDALSCVLLARLPFRVPTEPIVAARLEALTRRGADGFGAYTLPEAVLRLRQGFGRLIRRRTDRGAVILADTRVVTRPYGATFLDSLPPARRLVAPAAVVVTELRRLLAP